MDKLQDILERVASGELSPEEARPLLSTQSKTARPNPKKRKRGRPHGTISKRRKENYSLILGYWVLFHDRIPKMELRRLLAEGLHVEESYVGKAIARINSLEKDGAFIGRSKDGHVIALTAEEARRAEFRQTLGMSSFRQGELLKVLDFQRKPGEKK